MMLMLYPVRRFLDGVRLLHPYYTDLRSPRSSDQISSLIFSLSNVYVIPCIYATEFDDDWRERCMAESSEWPVLFAIGTIPLFIRAVQCAKRYFDTGKLIQLANVRRPPPS